MEPVKLLLKRLDKTDAYPELIKDSLTTLRRLEISNRDDLVEVNKTLQFLTLILNGSANVDQSISKDVIDQIIFILSNIKQDNDEDDMTEIWININALFANCVEFSTNEQQEHFQEFGLTNLRLFNKESSRKVVNSQNMSIFGTLDLMSHLLKCNFNWSTKSTWINEIFEQIIISLQITEDAFCGKILTMVFPAVLDLSNSEISTSLERVWDIIKETYVQGDSGIQRAYMLLCGLSDRYLPIDGKPIFEIRHQKKFWEIIQYGISHKNPLSRKRSMYLLKRMVDTCEHQKQNLTFAFGPDNVPIFQWSKKDGEKLSSIWEDYFLLMETLDEKQTHVIRPVMPRFENLVNASCATTIGTTFHTSWLCTIIKRASIHESANILRWAVQSLFDIDLKLCPMLEQGCDKFFCGELVKILTDSSLYARSFEGCLGSIPPLAKSLGTFLTNCHDVIEPLKRTQFFESFINGVARESWGGPTFLYVSQALAELPKSGLLGAGSIGNLREIVIRLFSSMNTYLRGATQVFVTRTVLNLIDMMQVSIHDVSQFLAVLRTDECIQRPLLLWMECSQWLLDASGSNYVNWSAADVRDYLQSSLKDLLFVQLTDDGDSQVLKSQSSLVIARFLLMYHDAMSIPSINKSSVISKDQQMNNDHLDYNERTNGIQAIFHPVIDVLNQMNSNAYMPSVKVDRALQFMLMIYEEAGPVGLDDPVLEMMRHLLKPHSGEVLVFLQRRIHELDQMHQVELIKLYSEVLAMLYKLDLMGDISVDNLLSLCLTLLAVTPAEVTMETQMQKLSAICFTKTLYKEIIQQKDRGNSIHVILNITQNVEKLNITSSFERPNTGEDDISHNAWGKIASEYITSQWDCVQVYLAQQNGSGKDLGDSNSLDLMNSCIEALNVCQAEGATVIFNCLKHLVSQVVHADQDLCQRVIKISWNKVIEEAKSLEFWGLWKAYLNLVFQEATLKPNVEAPIVQYLLKQSAEIVSLGEDRGGQVNIFILHLSKIWQQNWDIAAKFTDFMIECATFGKMSKRCAWYYLDAFAYIDGLGVDFPANQLQKNYLKSNGHVRCCIVTYFNTLDLNNNNDVALARSLIASIIAKQLALTKVPSFRNFPNSMPHRLKQRLISALLVLEPFMDLAEVERHWATILELLLHEKIPSVRCMVEWFTVRLINRCPSFIPKLWDELRYREEKRSACICSLLSITSQLGTLQPDHNTQELFFLEAIPHILPWCLSHHFNIRVFSQSVMMKTWLYCKDKGLKNVLDKHNVVECCLDINSGSGHAAKSTLKLMENFFFCVFHPLRDHSLQSIFHTIPRLNGVTDEEWIH
ncbi:unnamed protein product, partial [Owenia fusiformis]